MRVDADIDLDIFEMDDRCVAVVVQGDGDAGGTASLLGAEERLMERVGCPRSIAG